LLPRTLDTVTLDGKRELEFRERVFREMVFHEMVFREMVFREIEKVDL
jgi:hypothetical protein